MSKSATQRFTSRAENYRKYRPGYPSEVIAYLAENANLTPQSIIADIGSGTGLLTQVFLKHGNPVYAVEPNLAMRQIAEKNLSRYSNFTSIDASAEATTLPDQAIDLITAAQAFHWFDRAKTKSEFRRILKPGGQVMLIWNTRDQASPIVSAYEDIINRYCPEQEAVVHTNTASQAIIESFFAPNSLTTHTFFYSQNFDYPALRGRLLSSSYVPSIYHPNYDPMLVSLKYAFDQHHIKGRVEFNYLTEVFLARV